MKNRFHSLPLFFRYRSGSSFRVRIGGPDEFDAFPVGDTRHLEQVEVEVADDIGRGAVGPLEAHLEPSVALAVGLGVHVIVRDVVTGAVSPYLGRTEVVGPAAPVQRLLMAQIEIGVGQVAGSAPLGAGNDAAQDGRGAPRLIARLRRDGESARDRRRFDPRTAVHEVHHEVELDPVRLGELAHFFERLFQFGRLVHLDEFAVEQQPIGPEFDDGYGLIVVVDDSGGPVVGPQTGEALVKRVRLGRRPRSHRKDGSLHRGGR